MLLAKVSNWLASMLGRWHTSLVFLVFLALVAGWADDISSNQGVRGPETPCEHVNQLCKWDPTCAESHQDVRDLRNFLVTGTGSSGTAWVRASLQMKGFDAADESWGALPSAASLHEAQRNASDGGYTVRRVEEERLRVNQSLGRDGMVSWPARCWATASQLQAMEDADEGYGLQLFQLGLGVRFRVVVHLIRHPLKSINSNRHFSDHLKQCKQFNDMDKSSSGGAGKSDGFAEYCEWNWWRLQQWEYARIFTPIPSHHNDTSAWPYVYSTTEQSVTTDSSMLELEALDAYSSLNWPGRGGDNEVVLPPPGQPGGFLLWERNGALLPPPLDNVSGQGSKESGPWPSSSSYSMWSLRNSIAITALHWRTWNAEVAKVADITVRLEDGVGFVPGSSSISSGGDFGVLEGSPFTEATVGVLPGTPSVNADTSRGRARTSRRDQGDGRSSAPATICLWLLERAIHEGWPPWVSGSSVNCSRPDASSSAATNSHGGDKRTALTWGAVGRALAGAGLPPEEFKALRVMAERYGYDSGDSGS